MLIWDEKSARIPVLRQECHAGNRRCPTCVLNVANGGPCKGCPGDCATQVCDTQCGACGGHDYSLVAAICCKSPLKEMALLPVNREYPFKKRNPIHLDNKAVLTIIGGRSSVTGDESPYVDEWDAIAVNLRHVWSARGGWYSRDLKDYMMIPKEKKLILLTAMYDDVLDAAWKIDLFEGFREVGFDYWCPLVFSIYSGSARMYSWWNHKRTEYSLWKSEGHFWSGDIVDVGFQAKDEFKAAMIRVPNVIVNMQLLDSTESGLRNVYTCLRQLHELMPPEGTLWLTGVGAARVLKVCLIAAPGREVYTLSTVPWIVPHKGKLVQRDGKIADRSHKEVKERSKKDLLFESQRNFIGMVEDCYAEVGRLTSIVKPATSRYPQGGQAGKPARRK